MNSELRTERRGTANHQTYIDGKVRGFFTPFTFRDLSAIVDGTSNTVAFSESAVSASVDGDMRLRGGIVSSVSGGYAWNGNPSKCFNSRSGNELSIAAGGSFTYNYRGQRTVDGRIICTGFVTVLPPNSPSCSPVNNSLQPGFSTMTANGYHGGGVNAALGDGSVRFVSETIDSGNVNNNQNLQGESA